jgi:hypothetical protein
MGSQGVPKKKALVKVKIECNCLRALHKVENENVMSVVSLSQVYMAKSSSNFLFPLCINNRLSPHVG